MIPSRYLYSAIGALALTVVSLLSTWGHGVSTTITTHEKRIQAAEQSEAVHTAQFKAIDDHIQELIEEVRGLREDANNRNQRSHASQ